jgi:DNA repair exonuclease SbcCD nuclease subunit
MKAFHIGDPHFSVKYLDKCLAVSRQIESIAQEKKPDLIVIPGDLQDKLLTVENGSAYSEMLKHIQKLAETAPLAILYGNASHDPAGSLEPLKLLETHYPIHISDYPETLYLYSGGMFERDIRFSNEIYEGTVKPTCTIHQLPYPTKEFLLRNQEDELQIDNLNQIVLGHLRNIFIGFRAKNIDGVPTIFNAHINVGNAKLSNGQTIHGQDIIIPKSDLELIGYDYGALNHIHLPQEINSRTYYAGSTHPCNWGEVEWKSVNLVEINGETLIVDKIRLDVVRPMVKHSCQLVDGCLIRCQEEAMDNDWQDAELRVIVTMSEEQRVTYDENVVKKFYAGAFSYKIEPEVIHTEHARSENIAEAVTLTDQFKRWGIAVEKQDKITDEVITELQHIELEYQKKTG